MVLLGGLMVAALTITCGLLILRSRDRTLAVSASQLQTMSNVLAAQTQQAFDSVRLVQADIAQSVQDMGARSREGLAALAAQKPLHDLLQQEKAGLPSVEAFMVLSLQGRLLSLSRTWPTPDIVADDRDYIRAFQLYPGLRDFISEPVKAHGSGLWTVFLVHGLRAPDGSLIGLVAATLRLQDFETFYGSLSLPQDASIALFRNDGMMLARYPHLESGIGRLLAGNRPLFRDVLRRPGGSVALERSVLDGEMRVIAGRMVDRFPAVVSVSRPADDVLAVWKAEAIQMATATALADLFAIAAGLLGFLQIRRATRLARFDKLTETPNRLMFHESLASAFQRRTRGRTGFALLLIDLDRFKEINDSLGHQAGDDLLKALAARIRRVLRPGEVLARLGGDEFAVIQTGLVRPSMQAAALAERLLRLFQDPFDLTGFCLHASISVGVAVAPEADGDPDQLYRNADLALYQAKEARRNTYRMFEPAMAEQSLARKSLERDLSAAVGADAMSLAFQPILDLSSGTIRTFEALLRWTHPTQGEIPPARFVPVAEESGIIGPLGRWVLRRACMEAVRWPEGIRVAVNLSPAQFRSGDVVADIEAALRASGLPAGRLEVEITESVQIVEDERVGRSLRRIKDLGVAISLDDFGTGYSSLSYLRSFPFDKIKIDRSFVADMQASVESASIVDTVLMLARRLGMRSTAEGVETAEQLAILRQAGCSEIQGYHISRPLTAEAVPALIARFPPGLAAVA